MNETPTSQRMNIEDLHYQGEYGDIICTPDNLPFTGVVHEYSSSGSLIAEYEVNSGLKHGIEKKYYSEGVIEEIEYYLQGILHGDVTFYYPGGGPREKSVFEYGIRTEGFFWDEDGVLLRHQVLELKEFQRVTLERRRRENKQ